MGPGKKMILMAGVIFLAVLFAVFGIWRSVFSHANPGLRMSRVAVGNIVFSAETATTTLEQARGLSGRAGLGRNEGMLFLFGHPSGQNFWMKDMKFPIDIIWIGGGKVLGFAENAVPEPGIPLLRLKIYSSPAGVDTVLEVNSGTVLKDNIKVGDAVVVSGAE